MLWFLCFDFFEYDFFYEIRESGGQREGEDYADAVEACLIVYEFVEMDHFHGSVKHHVTKVYFKA